MKKNKITNLKELLNNLLENKTKIISEKITVLERYHFSENSKQSKITTFSIKEINLLLKEVKNIEPYDKKILEEIGSNLLAQKILSSTNLHEISELIQRVNMVSNDKGQELLGLLPNDKLATKITRSENVIAITDLLEEINRISNQEARKLLDTITDEKIVFLVREFKDNYQYRCLSIIAGIDENRMEKLYPKVQELFYQKKNNAKNLDELYYLFYWLESSSKKEAKKLLQRTAVEDIVKLITPEIDSEDIAGMIEVIGKISKEKAVQLFNQIEDIIISHAEEAEESGDITDVLEIMTDISKEKAEELLNNISIEFIARRILEIDHLNRLGSIAHILSHISHISKAAAEDLLSKIGIETIKEKILKSQHYYPGVIKILEAINDISQDKVRYLIKDIDVNHVIDQTRNIYDSSWLLEFYK